MNTMKEDSRVYELSRDAVLNRIETQRITKTNIFWTYLNNLDEESVSSRFTMINQLHETCIRLLGTRK
jgi:hypothetical protein